MLSYDFDMNKKDFYDNELCKECSGELEDQIHIRTIALDLLRNWNAYRQSGNDIHKEFLFSITELADFFYIRIDKQIEFEEMLTKAHKYFQKNKGNHDFANISYNINGNIYFFMPNLLKVWPLVENIIVNSVYYIEKR